MTGIHSNFKSYLTHIPLSPAVQRFMNRLMNNRVVDVAMHLPTKIENRVFYKQIHDVPHQGLCTLILTVSHFGQEPKKNKGIPFSVFLSDGISMMEAIYFRPNMAYLKRLYPIGKEILISGVMNRNSSMSSSFGKILHPDFVGEKEDLPKWHGIKPIYPLTGGVKQPFMQRFVAQILKELQPFPEWIPENILAKLSLPKFDQAARLCHTKEGIEMPLSQNRQKVRLIFDEFLAHQLALILSSRRAQKNAIVPVTITTPPLVNDFIKKLPYSLTQGQNTVIHEIFQDFEQSDPMVRLLQGDVGSGKTVVAFVTALYQIAKGGQVALLAPTEILAQQHFINIETLFKDQIRVALLTGKTTIKQRRLIQSGLDHQQIDLLIGTHALIQESVTFKNLTYCIIDEQHRFGVEQRMALNKKGTRVDLLSMTATPIPRSLTLAQYGDMDVSTLYEKPKGRIGIKTSVMAKDRYLDLVDRLKLQISQGIQVYWVCPVVEESQTYTAAKERFTDLQKRLGETTVGLIHGKMKASEKEQTMQDFKDQKCSVLVATTVIEVGVDVPNASVMIIEHAERFGLAQLHQLRGRVGRGSKESFCILLYGDFLSPTARQRLNTMKETDNGFKLAEMDLKLRGSGELTGTQQSGLPTFKFSSFDQAIPSEVDLYTQLMEEANTCAWQILTDTTRLAHAKQYLLPLFEKNVDFTQSG
ncbi:MAG: ATP-dependent DNA helicase RecG [Holosporales bacterium]